jgi:hypothetical protein
LGALLKQALASDASTGGSAAAMPPVTDAPPAPPGSQPAVQHCADCWYAVTFTGEKDQLMARCEKNLWMRPVYTHDDLNQDKVRRWHAVCPEYDDSE